MSNHAADFHFRRTYRGPIQAVIFDWAGTTIDHGCRAPAIVFVEVFKHHGVEITMEEAREPMGMHKRDHLSVVAAMPRVARRWHEAHGRPCSENDIDAMFEDFVPRQLACLADYAELIPGASFTADACRQRGYKIGSTTGYNREMTDLLIREAEPQGYQPDSSVCATEVPAARPAPWMCLENAKQLGVYPTESIVKVGDTLSDIDEGLNAGMWTIGITRTGNELGLCEAEVDALTHDELQGRLTRAKQRMRQRGAHYVAESVADIMPCLDDIERRLAAGERP